MDIIKRIKPLKATYDNVKFRTRFAIVITLISLWSIIIPHQSTVQAYSGPDDSMEFAIGDYEEYFGEITFSAKKKYTHEQVVAELKRQIQLAERLRQYLITENSPLADHASTLIQQNNWKKIIALSNAESSLCRRYPLASNNCWGVGGSNLWKMGDNLDEGIISMNRFLNNYPLRSSKKYSQMSFENMNGLYKQPPGDHWVANNQIVYEELTQLENGYLTYND